jgi:tight adherence protein C
MALIIVFGVSVFMALMLCFLLLMGRSSAQSALLEQVTREVRSTGPVSAPWGSFFLIALVVGFFVPDFWLSHAINRRRHELKRSLPDGLDLMSICLEAGLGMDQAVVRVGQELEMSHRALSEELLLINFEQRAGVQRIAAWQSFATRAGFESARSFVAMLVQTDRFGTPIAKSLSVFSDALRTQRRQLAEERAAKTTIKLVPPLVFCIFPSMGVVIVGPAFVAIKTFFAHFLH